MYCRQKSFIKEKGLFAYKEAIVNASNIYPQRVTFLLKTSSGDLFKTFYIPVENADSFAKAIKVMEPGYRLEAGEKEPLRIVKVERIF